MVFGEILKLVRPAGRLLAMGLVLAAALVMTTHARAQEGNLVWSFGQANDANGRSSATLTYGVPETDNVQVYAVCGAQTPANMSHFIIAADFGDQVHGTPTKIRFSGGGKEIEITGVVERPASEEGLFGVKLTVANDDPVWTAFDSNAQLAYQVPGYAANNLPLTGGQAQIRNFVEACRFFAGNSGGQTATAQPVMNERDAFAATRQLGTVEAWQAFLNTYQTGFFADLARAYLAKEQAKTGQTAQPAQPAQPVQPTQPVQPVQPTQPVQPASLPYFKSQPGYTPWYNFNYEQDEGNARSYAAGVKAGGLELLTWCTASRTMGILLREDVRGTYPQFDQRIEQGIKADRVADINVPGKGFNRIALQVYGLTGEVGAVNELAPAGQIISALMSGNNVVIDHPPFAATFQLKGSRKAICNVINRCGAIAPGCQRPAPIVRPATVNREPARTVCRSRSVWVPGRGCILKKYANTGRKNSSGCRGGRIRFEGQCMFKSERRGYCGPGFTPRGSKCVSNARVVRKPRLQQGVYVTEAWCNRKGLIKEGNYCVEND